MNESPDSSLAEALMGSARRLSAALSTLSFSAPVAYVYDPSDYAAEAYSEYLQKFALNNGTIMFLGMNPGPFGMVQTGIPFGAIPCVSGWMGIEARIGKPPVEHPKRPVLGFSCTRVEASGKRLWGLFAERYPDPLDFFSRHIVLNYCPLAFMDYKGANLVPETLVRPERERLLKTCDASLRETLDILRPSALVGVGTFAEARLRLVSCPGDPPVLRIPHPSPANPRANKSWAADTVAVMESSGLWT